MNSDLDCFAQREQRGEKNPKVTPVLDLSRARKAIVILAFSMGLLMTGYAIVMPIFARRLGELGFGVGALSLMLTSYALAGIVASPIMGALADRFGRRPMVLGSLLAFVLSNIGFVLVNTTEMLVLVRALEGALTAGMVPAALGIVADIAPKEKRTRWIGYVMGGASAGWVMGPLAGGVLYDLWGYQAPFLLSAATGLLAFVVSAFLIQETKPATMEQPESQHGRVTATQNESFWASLPRPLTAFVVLLFSSFVMFFTWTFFEPQLLFYLYDDLGWTATQFGFAAGWYGLATTLSQALLGRVGDKFGRKPVIVVGLIFFSTQFASLVLTSSMGVVAVFFAFAGLGEGLVTPALSAFLFDISEERHRARVMGVKSSAGSLGGVLGPLLAAALAGVVPPRIAFVGTTTVVLLCALLALVVLREPNLPEGKMHLAWDVLNRRINAARTSLRGILSNANSTRNMKGDR